jgi:hypothetical protein
MLCVYASTDAKFGIFIIQPHHQTTPELSPPSPSPATTAMSNLNAPSSPFVPFSPNPSIQSGVPTTTPPLSATAKFTQPGSNLRYASSRKTIYDRHLNRTQRADLSKASFAFLFSEMIQYAQKQVSGIQDLEKKCVARSPRTSSN